MSRSGRLNASPSSQPTLARAASVLWFPMVFAALFAALALASFTHPSAHDVRLGVVAGSGGQAQVDSFSGRLDRDHPTGFRASTYSSVEAAEAAVRRQDVVAAVVLDEHPELVVATASSVSRVSYLQKVLPAELAAEGLGQAVKVDDVATPATNDQTGNAVYFWALPLVVVGLVTAILLLQFAAWSLGRKLAAIAVIGAVSSVLVWAIATGMDVLPTQPLLLVYGFLITQVIGWIMTGMTPFVRQFFVPVAMTFVLALGAPSAGGTVVGDLLPQPVRWLNEVMPMAQVVSLARAAAYFDGHGTPRPLLILLGWLVAGAALMYAAHRRGLAQQRALAVAHARAEASSGSEPPAPVDAGHALAGSILAIAGTPLAGATVVAVDGTGGRLASAATGPDGHYRIEAVPSGLLHVAVVAPHAEPEIATVVVHRRQALVRHDVVLVDWEEPVDAEARSQAQMLGA